MRAEISAAQQYEKGSNSRYLQSWVSEGAVCNTSVQKYAA
jgi:hypothetical protein